MKVVRITRTTSYLVVVTLLCCMILMFAPNIDVLPARKMSREYTTHPPKDKTLEASGTSNINVGKVNSALEANLRELDIKRSASDSIDHTINIMLEPTQAIAQTISGGDLVSTDNSTTRQDVVGKDVTDTKPSPAVSSINGTAA